jgi:hypothetical protein
MAPRPTAPPSRMSAPMPQNASAGRGRSSPSQRWIFILILVAAGFLVGAITGLLAGYRQGKSDEMRAVTSRMTASGAFPKSLPLHSLNGTVIAVSSDGFEIQVMQTVRNPLANPAPLTRTVKVTASTKMTETVRKSDAEFKADVDAFQLALKNAAPGTPAVPPQPFTEKTVALSDIQEGMRVFVTSDVDLTTAASITATAVSVQEGPGNVAPPPMPSAPPTPTVMPKPAPTPAKK